MEDEKESTSGWTRRRIILCILGLITLLAISLGLGLGLGLKNDDDDSKQAGTPWQPKIGTKWQIVLLKPIDTSDSSSLSPDVDIWDIDLFTNSKETIAALKDGGKRVICYFSAGSYEDYRPDSDDFKEEDMGSELDGWPGERWLNLRNDNVRSIMSSRIDIAKDKGCDAIDPDNVDGYQNKNGLGLTSEDSVDFMRYLASEAADRGLSCGLKNAGDIIVDVLDVVHFSVNEQCAEFSECETFAQFTDVNKPVFQIEYPAVNVEDYNSKDMDAKKVITICSREGQAEGSANFSTVIKKMNLDGWVQYCDGQIATTDLKGSTSE